MKKRKSKSGFYSRRTVVTRSAADDEDDDAVTVSPSSSSTSIRYVFNNNTHPRNALGKERPRRMNEVELPCNKDSRTMLIPIVADS